jgi:hypothetical protein
MHHTPGRNDGDERKVKANAADDGAEINPQELGSAIAELDQLGKHVEAEHVEEQMRPAGMEKCGGDEAMEFFACQYGFGIENVFLLEREALEAQIRYPNRQCDNQVCADWRCSKHSDLWLRSRFGPCFQVGNNLSGNDAQFQYNW